MKDRRDDERDASKQVAKESEVSERRGLPIISSDLAGEPVDARAIREERLDRLTRRVDVDPTELRGLLKRPRRRPVSVKAMNAAILGQHSRKR